MRVLHQEREPLRLQLAPTWLDIENGVVAPAPEVPAALPVRGTAERSAPRPCCAHCGGDLIRSRVHVYEQLVTPLTGRRPYRCVDCRLRRWR